MDRDTREIKNKSKTDLYYFKFIVYKYDFFKLTM